MRKRVLVTIFTAELFLAACGSKGSDTVQPVNDETSVETTTNHGVEESESTADVDGFTPVGGTIRVGTMTNSELQWIVAVAQEKGIFAQYGLTVETTEFAAGIQTVDAIVQGQLDIGYAADFAAVNRIGQVADVTDLTIFTINNHSGDSYHLYYNPKTVTDINDISGKNVRSGPGTVAEYWVYKLLEYQGLSVDDVNIVNTEDNATTLALAANDELDLIFANPVLQEKLEEYGWQSSEISTETIGSLVYSLLVANRSYLDANNDLVATFLLAYEEAQDYVLSNTDEAADIVYQVFGLDQESFLTYIGTANLELGIPNAAVQDLNEINEWAYHFGLYEHEYNVEDFIDSNPLNTAFGGAQS